MTVRILVGDVRERLAQLEPDSFDCVVTSPPYWGLRDYDCEGQIGLEPTLGEHLAVMVEVFQAVRRVLKPSGTLWLNYGDCYATSLNGRSAADTKAKGIDDRTFRDKPFSTIPKRSGRSENLGNRAGDGVRRNNSAGLIKAKDLCMIPNRLAIALCDDGWFVRAECIWGKSNAMPDSSGSQRPSSAHEKVFFLTKSGDADIWRARDTKELSFNPDLSERCALVTDPTRTGARWLRLGAYYNAEAVLQARISDEDAATYRGDCYVGGEPGPRKVRGNKQASTAAAAAAVGASSGRRMQGFNARWDDSERRRALTPRHEGHINHTGTADLGRGEGRFLRSYEPAPLAVWEIAIAPFKDAHFATFPPELAERALLAGCPVGGKVLDPFGGAGTVGLVADRLGLDCTLIELNPGYAEIASRRIERDAGMFSAVSIDGASTASTTDRLISPGMNQDLFEESPS